MHCPANLAEGHVGHGLSLLVPSTMSCAGETGAKRSFGTTGIGNDSWKRSGRSKSGPGGGVHVYVMKANHCHLLLETPEPNLVAGMRWFRGTYTIRFNFRHGLSGHLFPVPGKVQSPSGGAR